MKKYIILLLIVSFITVSFQPINAAVDTRYKSAGEKLQQMGIIKGYKDGLLHEESYITQGQALVILSRTLQIVQKNKRPNLIKMSNQFDVFINKVYHAYLIAKYKILNVYFDLISLFPKYEVISGINRNNWMFKDLLYLKRNGFQFPADFDIRARVSEQEMLNWEMQVLNIGNDNEKVVGKEQLTQSEVNSLLSVEHRLLPDNSYNSKNILNRGDVFLLVLNVIEE